MSIKKQIVELEPSGRIHNEAFVSAPMTCRYCNGRGGFPIDTVEGPSMEERLTAREPARSLPW